MQVQANGKNSFLHVWPDPYKGTPPWTRSFADIALRGLLKLHLDYLLWSTPQDFESGDYRSQLLTGPGIALADEVTACASITQEFLASRAPFGGWVPEEVSKGIEGSERYYRIWREWPYKKDFECADANIRADIRIERIAKDKSKSCFPIYIEAKRAYGWTTKCDGADERPSSNRPKVAEVIKQLRQYQATAEIRFAGYVLVWNIVEQGNPTNHWPEKYFQSLEIDKTIVLWQTRAAPLVSKETLDNPAVEAPQVNRWLWVALAEVTKIPKDEYVRPENYEYE